jgi:hypothetical protein
VEKKKPGHASTAVTRKQGNLQDVKIPSGSQFIYPPNGGSPLLSVDSVGSLWDCSDHGCSPLGWNEWEKKGKEVKAVYRYDDPKLDTWGLRAWKKNGGLYTFSPTDRRKEKREKVIQEIESNKTKWKENTSKRLKKLNIEQDKIPGIVRKATPYRSSNAEGWGVLLLLVSGLVGTVFANMFYRRMKRKQISDEITKAEEDDQF